MTRSYKPQIGEEQAAAIKELQSGENVFLTGSAGCGKTFLAKWYQNSNNLHVALTATTGIAALNLGGETIHKFSGIGISTRLEQAADIIARWHGMANSDKPKSQARYKLIREAEVLVIDEVSMLRRDQFELLNEVLKKVRGHAAPFGGLQLILVGDFYQLPPVVTSSDLKTFPDLEKPYCFQSPVWKEARIKTFTLKTNWRQNDKDFLDILEEVRTGKISKENEGRLCGRLGSKCNGPISPVKLFPTNTEVSRENAYRLRQLPGKESTCEAAMWGDPYSVEALKKDCIAETLLSWKCDAQIMMLTNDPDDRWVNGSLGTIVGENEEADTVQIQLSDGGVVCVDKYTWEKKELSIDNGSIKSAVLAKMTQFPFKLAYATTIHKSQGLTLDCAEIDLQRCFAAGQAYVALSRVKSLHGLTLKGWNSKSIVADSTVTAFLESQLETGKEHVN